MPVLQNKPTTNATAYDLVLKGLYATRPGTEQALREGMRYFEKATKQDPKLALAYAAWANCYTLASGQIMPSKDVFPRARELVTKALELDPNSSEAHMARGNIALQCDLDWKMAETEFQKAISLNPGNVEAHVWYAILLATVQRFDEAKDEIRESIRLNPGAAFAWNWLANIYYFSGDLYVATGLAEELRDRDVSSFWNRLATAFCYAATGRTADALKEAEHLVAPPSLGNRIGRAVLLAILGKPEDGRPLMKELEETVKTTYVPMGWIAELYAALGEKEKALETLERDLREGDKSLWMDYQGPWYERIRNEPRFISLLRKYKLPVEGTGRAEAFRHTVEGMKEPAGVHA